MDIDFTQRWKNKKPVYRPLRECINPLNFEIAAIDEMPAKEFVLTHHYSSSYCAARRRFGLFEKGELVGVAVYSHPMAEKVITNVFNCDRARDGLELGRLVLKDSVLSNAESYFVAECHRQLRKEGFCGVVSFSDDVSRYSESGEKTHVGHLGTVYQSLNSAFLGRGTARALKLLPDGRVFSDRTAQKVRKGEIGWEYGSQILESFGATKCPVDDEPRRAWLKFWTAKLTRTINHPGNLKYAWSFSQRGQLKSLPYPKIRYCDVQPAFDFGLKE